MTDFIISMFGELLFSFAEKRAMKITEKRRHDAFLQEMEDWCNEYILKNEHTVISGDDFYNFIKYYNLIQNIISFIRHPENQLEVDFLDSCHNSAIDYLKERNNLTPDDIRSVKEFIDGVFEKTYKYYESQISNDGVIATYQTVQLNSKVDEMQSDIKDIKTSISPKKTEFIKKIYSMPENTIIRKIALYKDIQESYILMLHKEEFLEACLKEKHIVLLGDAGCGKSIALKQLAAMVTDTNFYPLQYNLTNYTDGSIEDIIFSEYPDIRLESVFLMFDAYDEIEETNRNRFARKLSEFAAKNPNTVIVISSRNNFYKFSDDEGKGGLFDTFKEYGIAPITHNDIKAYIEDNGIIYDEFWHEVYNNGLYALISIPFYLRELIRIYKRKGCLPQKSMVMEEIISSRFDNDRKKYVKTKDLENYEEEMFSCLEKLAFSIHCLHTVKISNREYQKLFDNEHHRNLISYSGVFSKSTDNEWSFEHNNFREYLTAKYINRLSIHELKKLMLNKYGKINNSWVNVLSFLVLIREDNDLLNLLITNDPEMIIRFERSRLDEQLRNELVMKIMDDFSQKNVWLSQGLNSSRGIAKFGQSKVVCEYLLNQINSPVNLKTQRNALSVLSEFSDLFGMENKIREVLFACLQKEDVRMYEKGKILETIATLKLMTPQLTSFVIETFNHELLGFYRLSVLEYLNAANLFEDYIDLYIEEYKLTNRHFDESSSIRYEVLDVFVKCKRANTLSKIISAIATQTHTYSNDKDEYSKIVLNAIESYKNGDSEIFNQMIDALVESEIHNAMFFESCICFFDKTDTRKEAFISLLEKDLHLESHKVVFPMERIADNTCYMFLLSEYEKNPNKYVDAVKEFALRFNEDNPFYSKYKDALLSNGVVIPEKRLFFDYQKAMQSGQQYYFDCLFDKDKYCSLLDKFLLAIDNKNIVFSEIKDLDYHPVNYKDTNNKEEEYALLQLYHSLMRYESDDRAVLDTVFGMSDWKYYIVSEAYYLLEADRKINVNNEQRKFFKEYCDEQIQYIDFQKEFSCDKENHFSYSPRLVYFVFFSEMFNFEYDSNVYNELLKLPSFFFDEKGKQGSIPAYVMNKFEKHELEVRIKQNLEQETLYAGVMNTYIQYCNENNLEIAVIAAEKICLNISASSWLKHSAVDYLNKIKGYEYIYDRFLDIDDRELLDNITEMTINYRDERLKCRLEEISRQSPQENLYLAKLIFMNSHYALERYLEICRETMKSTSIPYTSHLDSVIEAVSVVFDINLLETIGELRKLVFTEGFEDLESFGLRNSLYKAYQNLSNTDFFAVKKHLEEALKTTDISDDEKGFCNSVIMDTEYARNSKEDVVWSIEEIKEFLKNY